MTINKNNHVVIIAGGIGSRFWPMSNEERPKQFLDILGVGKTMIQLTVERFVGEVCPIENIWIVTSQKFASIVEVQVPEIPKQNILLEPCRRNTGPCIAYVSWAIKKRCPNANIVVAASDHFIRDVELFQTSINECLNFASGTDAIVTLGIKPTFPSTGYGYIQADLSYPSPTNHNIYRVDSFKEKPELEVAKQYLRENNYFWNSGIFIWNVNTIVNAFRVYQPEMAQLFDSINAYLGTEKEQEVINEHFPKCENISVDYAIMEHTEEIYTYPSDFGWSDVGNWSSLQGLLPTDETGNICIGNNIKVFDTNNCIIHTVGEKQVVVQGLNNCIVVEKDGILMICQLAEEQRIKLFH